MFVHLFHDGDILFGWKHLGVTKGPWYLILDLSNLGIGKHISNNLNKIANDIEKDWAIAFHSIVWEEI